MPYAEIMFVSALTGQRLVKLFDMVDTIIENQTMRVQTGVLNEIMTEAVAMQQPPSDKGKRLKIYYMTQVAVKPPTFVIFVNDKELMHFSYTRYLENQIRNAFGFKGHIPKIPCQGNEKGKRAVGVRKGGLRSGTDYMFGHGICLWFIPDRFHLRQVQRN